MVAVDLPLSSATSVVAACPRAARSDVSKDGCRSGGTAGSTSTVAQSTGSEMRSQAGGGSDPDGALSRRTPERLVVASSSTSPS